MKKAISILLTASIILLVNFGFAADQKNSISKGNITISYYQEGIKDKKTNDRVNWKSGNEFLKNTKEGIQVKTKDKTTLFYTPFSRNNREIAKKAGNKNTINLEEGDDHNYTMFLSMQSFLGFTDISPKERYVTYQVAQFEGYDNQSFYMMDARNGDHPLAWNTPGGCTTEGDKLSSRQPNGERFFYIDGDRFLYTISGKFPVSQGLFKTKYGIKGIEFDKTYMYVMEYGKGCALGGIPKRFKLSGLR